MNDTSRYPLNKMILKGRFDPEKERRTLVRDILKEVSNSGIIDTLAQREYEAMIAKYDDRAKRRFYRKAQDIGSREVIPTLAAAKNDSL